MFFTYLSLKNVYLILIKSLQSLYNVSMVGETDLYSNLLVEPEDFYGHLVHKSLLINSSSWVYLTMASDYFRYKGDFANSVKCLQRAIYYSPSYVIF